MKKLFALMYLISFILLLQLFTLAGYLIASLLFLRWIPWHLLPFLIAFAISVSVWVYWLLDPNWGGYAQSWKNRYILRNLKDVF